MAARTSCGAGPTVRQPDSVAVDERTGDVFVTGRAAGCSSA